MLVVSCVLVRTELKTEQRHILTPHSVLLGKQLIMNTIPNIAIDNISSFLTQTEIKNAAIAFKRDTHVVANLLLSYITSRWTALINTLNEHKYANLQWKILKDRHTTERDPKFSNIKAILFVGEDHVIVQDVELDYDATRFTVYKIMFQDWESVFVEWGDERELDWDRCMEDGYRMYGL